MCVSRHTKPHVQHSRCQSPRIRSGDTLTHTLFFLVFFSLSSFSFRHLHMGCRA
ncbi:hypothetical protein LX36DRAFT_745592 [Colletotrichum falcatum]|nr:hypothetical protein LX36DRAFT_745592 [Colletotrichum falcatum]